LIHKRRTFAPVALCTTRQRRHDVEVVQQGFGWIRGHGFLRQLPPGLQEQQRLVHDAAA